MKRMPWLSNNMFALYFSGLILPLSTCNKSNSDKRNNCIVIDKCHKMRLRTDGASHDVPGESPFINLELVKRESQELSLRRAAEFCDAGLVGA